MEQVAKPQQQAKIEDKPVFRPFIGGANNATDFRKFDKEVNGGNVAASGGMQSNKSNAGQSNLQNANLQNEIKIDPKENLKLPAFSSQEMLEAKQKSYEEGFTKGFNSAKTKEAEINQLINTSLDEIEKKLQAAHVSYMEFQKQQLQELLDFAIIVAKKIAGTAIQNDPVAAVVEVISNNLALLFNEPKVNIEVHPEMVTLLDKKLVTIIKNEAALDNIEILGNAALSLGSSEIKWNGGGIKSDKVALLAEIEKALIS